MNNLQEALQVTKRIKAVPSKPNTIGYVAVQLILEKYEEDDFKWTRNDTNEIIEKVIEWCNDQSPIVVTKFKDTHVSYFRSVLKQNEKIEY